MKVPEKTFRRRKKSNLKKITTKMRILKFIQYFNKIQVYALERVYETDTVQCVGHYCQVSLEITN